MDSPLSGIVLAGGQSRRMGRDKAGLAFGGTSLVCWVAGRLGPACAEVIVVARSAADCAGCGARVIGDRWPDAGPLGGLATGLDAVATPLAAAVACDLPFVERALLCGLAGLAPDYDAVVPEIAGRAQPLCAVYRRTAGQAAEAVLRRGDRSLHDLLALLDLRVCYVPEETLRKWDPALRSFDNINTPEDYERALAVLSGGPPGT